MSEIEILEAEVNKLSQFVERCKEEVYQIFCSGCVAGREGFVRVDLIRFLEMARLEKDCRDKTANPFDSDYVYELSDIVELAKKETKS